MQFGLRFLFGFLTLFAILFGGYANRVWSQRNVVAQIRSLGGSVWYEYEVDATHYVTGKPDSNVPPALQAWLGPDWFHHIAAVGIGSSKNSSGLQDKDLQVLLTLGRLRKLTLRDSTQVTEEGIQTLSKLRSLQWLFLHRPNIHASALQQLKSLTDLSHLDVATPVGDSGLAELAKFPALVELRVHSEGVTDSGVLQFARHRTLKYLELNGTYRVSAAAASELREFNPQLGIDDGSFDDWRFGVAPK
jgi:hypothetical protein